MAMSQWSTTPANNATAGSINWAEGQAPSTVNDSARQMMADVAVWFQSPEWLNYGQTAPTYVSGTQFTVTGNQTGIYQVGRRVRAFVTAGTIYGTITASTFATNTTVTVSWDSGTMDSGLSEVDVGLISPVGFSVRNLGPLGLNVGSQSMPALSLTGSSSAVGAGIYMLGNGGTTPAKTIRAFNGILQFLNNAGTVAVAALDDSGNFSAIAGISGSNITGTSDERLKKDWKPFEPDFLERVAETLSGTYTRIDTGERRVGVGAQSLRRTLPEAVFGDDVLSVAEGSAALAIVVELTREVLRLRAMLEPVK